MHPAAGPDCEAFRLRTVLDRLRDAGELEVVEEQTALADLAARMDGNPRAVLFRRAGAEGAEVLGNLLASRRRTALALGADERTLLPEILRRLQTPQPVVEVGAAAAPVQRVVRQGEAADLTRLPVPFQHGMDGGPYLSATLDYVTNPASGVTNVGCRRLMLRGRRQTGIDLHAPSDLKAIYEAAAMRGECLPIAFTVGSHPADYVAATMRIPMDETDLVARLRGAPLPVVKCVTNDIRVPADAEIVLEGWLDPAGFTEEEGPYGEFLGYYGGMRKNPVFNLTAITMREDPLFLTATISGRRIDCTDTAQLNAIKSEAVVWQALTSAIREPVAVNATAAAGGMFNLRLSMRQRVPGEARNAIAAVFGCLGNVKHVFVVDDDIDIFDDRQMDWALASRFQADRDLVVQTGFRAVPIDPSLTGSRVGAKAGFDLTLPFGRREDLEFSVAKPPEPEGARFADVRAALAAGPRTFEQLMAATGSRDGRDIVLALESLREEGRLRRMPKTGAYALED
jgi:UbiD family decarboxylase